MIDLLIYDKVNPVRYDKTSVFHFWITTRIGISLSQQCRTPVMKQTSASPPQCSRSPPAGWTSELVHTVALFLQHHTKKQKHEHTYTIIEVNLRVVIKKFLCIFLGDFLLRLLLVD